MSHNLTPWINTIARPGRSIAPWFSEVFKWLHENGFELQGNVPGIDIQDGNALTFKKDHAEVTASRFVDFPVAGESPGLRLSDEMESWETIISARTPFSVVFEALRQLNPDRPKEPGF